VIRAFFPASSIASATVRQLRCVRGVAYVTCVALDENSVQVEQLVDDDNIQGAAKK